MPKPPPTVIQDPNTWPVLEGKKIIDPPRLRRTWQNSRLVIQEDGTTLPVLHVLAEHLFGPWDPHTHYPVWKDMDWTNESLENVQLASRFGSRPKRPKNASGFPSGTPEYHKWYRTQHPEKQKEYNRNYYQSRKNKRQEKEGEVIEMKTKLAELEAENARLKAAQPAFDLETSNAKLEELLAEIKPFGEGYSTTTTPQPTSPDPEGK